MWYLPNFLTNIIIFCISLNLLFFILFILYFFIYKFILKSIYNIYMPSKFNDITYSVFKRNMLYLLSLLLRVIVIYILYLKLFSYSIWLFMFALLLFLPLRMLFSVFFLLLASIIYIINLILIKVYNFWFSWFYRTLLPDIGYEVLWDTIIYEWFYWKEWLKRYKWIEVAWKEFNVFRFTFRFTWPQIAIHLRYTFFLWGYFFRGFLIYIYMFILYIIKWTLGKFNATEIGFFILFLIYIVYVKILCSINLKKYMGFWGVYTYFRRQLFYFSATLNSAWVYWGFVPFNWWYLKNQELHDSYSDAIHEMRINPISDRVWYYINLFKPWVLYLTNSGLSYLNELHNTKKIGVHIFHVFFIFILFPFFILYLILYIIFRFLILFYVGFLPMLNFLASIQLRYINFFYNFDKLTIINFFKQLISLMFPFLDLINYLINNFVKFALLFDYIIIFFFYSIHFFVLLIFRLPSFILNFIWFLIKLIYKLRFIIIIYYIISFFGWNYLYFVYDSFIVDLLHSNLYDFLKGHHRQSIQYIYNRYDYVIGFFDFMKSYKDRLTRKNRWLRLRYAWYGARKRRYWKFWWYQFKRQPLREFFFWLAIQRNKFVYHMLGTKVIFLQVLLLRIGIRPIYTIYVFISSFLRTYLVAVLIAWVFLIIEVLVLKVIKYYTIYRFYVYSEYIYSYVLYIPINLFKNINIFYVLKYIKYIYMKLYFIIINIYLYLYFYIYGIYVNIYNVNNLFIYFSLYNILLMLLCKIYYINLYIYNEYIIYLLINLYNIDLLVNKYHSLIWFKLYCAIYYILYIIYNIYIYWYEKWYINYSISIFVLIKYLYWYFCISDIFILLKQSVACHTSLWSLSIILGLWSNCIAYIKQFYFFLYECCWSFLIFKPAFIYELILTYYNIIDYIYITDYKPIILYYRNLLLGGDFDIDIIYYYYLDPRYIGMFLLLKFRLFLDSLFIYLELPKDLEKHISKIWFKKVGKQVSWRRLISHFRCHKKNVLYIFSKHFFSPAFTYQSFMYNKNIWLDYHISMLQTNQALLCFYLYFPIFILFTIISTSFRKFSISGWRSDEKSSSRYVSNEYWWRRFRTTPLTLNSWLFKVNPRRKRNFIDYNFNNEARIKAFYKQVFNTYLDNLDYTSYDYNYFLLKRIVNKGFKHKSNKLLNLVFMNYYTDPNYSSFKESCIIDPQFLLFIHYASRHNKFLYNARTYSAYAGLMDELHDGYRYKRPIMENSIRVLNNLENYFFMIDQFLFKFTLGGWVFHKDNHAIRIHRDIYLPGGLYNKDYTYYEDHYLIKNIFNSYNLVFWLLFMPYFFTFRIANKLFSYSTNGNSSNSDLQSAVFLMNICRHLPFLEMFDMFMQNGFFVGSSERPGSHFTRRRYVYPLTRMRVHYFYAHIFKTNTLKHLYPVLSFDLLHYTCLWELRFWNIAYFMAFIILFFLCLTQKSKSLLITKRYTKRYINVKLLSFYYKLKENFKKGVVWFWL